MKTRDMKNKNVVYSFLAGFFLLMVANSGATFADEGGDCLIKGQVDDLYSDLKKANSNARFFISIGLSEKDFSVDENGRFCVPPKDADVASSRPVPIDFMAETKDSSFYSIYKNKIFEGQKEVELSAASTIAVLLCSTKGLLDLGGLNCQSQSSIDEIIKFQNTQRLAKIIKSQLAKDFSFWRFLHEDEDLNKLYFESVAEIIKEHNKKVDQNTESLPKTTLLTEPLSPKKKPSARTMKEQWPKPAPANIEDFKQDTHVVAGLKKGAPSGEMAANWFRYSYALWKDLGKIGFLFTKNYKEKLLNDLDQNTSKTLSMLEEIFEIYYDAGFKYTSDKQTYLKIKKMYGSKINQTDNVTRRLGNGKGSMLWKLENGAWRVDNISF